MAYTPQLTEQIRIDIGKMLLSHEMIKLFPSLDNYEEIKTQISNHWNDFGEVVVIRDFWNLVDSLMMGYKLKNITKDITSQIYTWSLVQAQLIDELKFSTDINNLESNTKTVSEVKAFLGTNSLELTKITDATRVAFPENDRRHLDPVIILNQDNSLFVHDGNGRLLKALTEGRETISAYIGTRTQAPKSNHWISTSYLMKLADARSKDLLLTAFRESDNATFEFQDRIIVDNQFKQEVLNAI